MTDTVISYPIPVYQNLPIESQNYKPSMFFISGISLGLTTTVTTTVNHNYVISQQCRLIIPPAYGSRLLNGKTGYVISIPSSNQIELDIVSQDADPFINAGTSQSAQILAIGDVNSGAINASGRSPTSTFIPGTFINIS